MRGFAIYFRPQNDFNDYTKLLFWSLPSEVKKKMTANNALDEMYRYDKVFTNKSDKCHKLLNYVIKYLKTNNIKYIHKLSFLSK